MSEEVHEYELSGLIDGELQESRADEVRRAIAADPQLRAAFERLVGLDDRCAAMGSTAAFTPAITLPARDQTPLLMPALAALATLLIVRILGKLPLAMGVSILLHATLLIVVMVGVILLTRRLSPVPQGTPSLPEA